MRLGTMPSNIGMFAGRCVWETTGRSPGTAGDRREHTGCSPTGENKRLTNLRQNPAKPRLFVRRVIGRIERDKQFVDATSEGGVQP